MKTQGLKRYSLVFWMVMLSLNVDAAKFQQASYNPSALDSNIVSSSILNSNIITENSTFESEPFNREALSKELQFEDGLVGRSVLFRCIETELDGIHCFEVEESSTAAAISRFPAKQTTGGAITPLGSLNDLNKESVKVSKPTTPTHSGRFWM